METGKTTRYFKYAIGEIILVVIGILIALQINNWNEARIQHNEEVKYLTNIKLDLKKDLISLDKEIGHRQNKTKVNTRLIAHMNGDPISDLDTLATYVYTTIMEERFTPNNSTYNELASSGNLSLIANDSIKKLLLELQELYKNNQFAIEHENFEYKEYINRSLFKYVDLDQLMKVYLGDTKASDLLIGSEDFDTLLRSKEYKNGLVISLAISKDFIPLYNNIKEKSEGIVTLINKTIVNDL